MALGIKVKMKSKIQMHTYTYMRTHTHTHTSILIRLKGICTKEIIFKIHNQAFVVVLSC